MNVIGAISDLSPLARKGGLYVLAGFAIAILLAAMPFLWLGSLNEQAVADKTEYDLIAARAARLAENGRVRLTEADQPGRLFIPAETAGTTLAAFQSLVDGVAGKNGLTVTRMTPLPTETQKGLAPYRLSVDATGSIEQLRGFLAEIESGLPLVIVTGFEIKPETAASSGEQTFPSENLAVSLRLEAYGSGGAQ